jgi:transcription termination factor Rho
LTFFILSNTIEYSLIPLLGDLNRVKHVLNSHFMDSKSLNKKTLAELKALANENSIKLPSKITKAKIIELIVQSTDKQIAPEASPKDTGSTIHQKQSVEQKALPRANDDLETSQKPATRDSEENSQNNLKNTYIRSATPPIQQNPTQKNKDNQQSTLEKSSANIDNGPKQNDNTVEVTGVLEIMPDGTHGVLRSNKLAPSDKDTYISISQVKKLKLRKGDIIQGIARLPKDNERYHSLLWINTVNETPIDNLKPRINFDDLKPVYPDKQIKLEIGQFPVSNRIIDLLAPIGFGQRAMIVAPPKAGKTTLLKEIARGINENHPNVTLMVVLIGERPEEVTDIERSVKGIVYASNFDDSPANQVSVAELSLERAKRMVEAGQDVIILMDSLTRLARAYNVALPASGRTLSGGLDPVSLYPSKRFFGAARNFENGASLTIVATSLVDTGSKMDDVIFEEFKGTGNMELKLDRRMANKRVFPAINLLESGTRNEELLLGTDQLQNSWKIRRMLESLGDEGNSALIDRMKSTKTNEEFLNTLHQY